MNDFDPPTKDRRYYLTERETVQLMKRLPGRLAVLELSFGPGWCAVEWKAGTPMPEAVKALGFMRGALNENTDGAGI